ncbi:unnamed protein product [Toxocara canis]|uniref:G_PROTEIN_RECEP_F1_2 domain-containing protein n=1 Tax=Toxocara canis TaxID=6265 RepID=A0A183VAY4_TOXCA|nr:unnamed protein product [Toxocara canis]
MMAKNSLSMRMARWVVAIVFFFSTLLHIVLLTHRDVKKSSCAADNAIVVHHYLSLSKPSIDQAFYYIQATCVNIIPLLILIVCCVVMAWRAFKHKKSSVVASQKTGRAECVLHLATATTVCHLVFEFPSEHFVDRLDVVP